MNEVAKLAREHKLIIAGGSAYPRIIDFAAFQKIAEEVGAWFMVDMAHFAGLVAGGIYPNPLPYAHVVTTTTHKTLRGPTAWRHGALHQPDLGKKIDFGVAPGLQGGPLMHVIAGKAVAFQEALQPSFTQYAKNVVANAQAMGAALTKRGYNLVSGGTDSHLILVDVRGKANLNGKVRTTALEHAGMTCNKNGIPFDPLPPATTSGIRLGSPAGTTRGFDTAEFAQIGNWIGEVLDGLSREPRVSGSVKQKVRAEVLTLCNAHPIYPNF